MSTPDDLFDEMDELPAEPRPAADAPPPPTGRQERGAETESGAEGSDDPPVPEFSSVYDFVDTHLIFIFARDTSKPQFRWCAKWWLHGEAVSRFEALWRAYEQLRLDPGTGRSVWWRDHAGPAMAALFDPDGPFDGCSAELGRHEPVCQMLPVEPMDYALLRQIMSGQLQEGNN